MTSALIWFRRDLRLADNPALHAAAAADRITALYIDETEPLVPWADGAASRWWLHHGLIALDRDLQARGGRLLVRRGDALTCLREVIAEHKVDAVHWNRRYEPAALARDRQIKTVLRSEGVQVSSHQGNLLVEPWQICTLQGGPYRVFTPYWRNLALSLRASPPLPLPVPVRFSFAKAEPTAGAGAAAIDALSLLPRVGWDSAFSEHWQPGEPAAQARLKKFLDAPVADYKTGRDRPDRSGTSTLSPYLAFGNISPRQILAAINQGFADPARPAEGAATFVRELGWREFSYHLLYHYPHTAERNMNPRFADFPWAEPVPALLHAWQKGATGIPFVDAGMRQLWQTGWMHNRVRMVVASALTKNLRYHWSHGARWFWDTLVDADLANNTQGWQWSAGTGADAAPYFRVFNPVTQGERFDPDGSYVRRFLPELAAVPDRYLQQPWKMDAGARARAGIEGTVYAAPLIDLAQTRIQALAAYRSGGHWPDREPTSAH